MGAYKPPVIKKADGPQGKAKVFIKGDRAKIVIEDADSGEENEYIIDIDDQNDEVKDKIQKGTWFVRLSGDKKKVYTIRPWEGMFELKFVGFAHEKGKDPAPKKDLKFDTLNFIALFEVVTDGPAKGMTFSARHRYAFAPVTLEDGKVATGIDGNVEWKGKITAVGKTAELLDLLGVWDSGPLPYRDNVLPAIEKRALRAERVFKALVKNSYVETLFGSDSEPDAEELPDDGNEEF